MVRCGWPSVSRLSFGAENLPPPRPFGWQPPLPPSFGICGDQTLWLYRLFTSPRGQRTVMEYPRASNLSYGIFINYSEKQQSLPKTLHSFLNKSHVHAFHTLSSPFSYLVISILVPYHHHFHTLSSPFSILIITVFIPYHCHLSLSLRNLELLFQPPEWKQVVLLFPSCWFCQDFTMILQQFRLIASTGLTVVFMLIFRVRIIAWRQLVFISISSIFRNHR